MRRGRFFAAALLAALAAAAPAAAQRASPFADWAAVVVAGDFRASTGAESEVFDNARRDIVAALVEAGFSPRNVRQLSVRPERYPDAAPMRANPERLAEALDSAASAAKGGCLLYLTSHGTPQGAIMGNDLLTPGHAANMLAAACGDRPTVAVISACFSGVFVPALAGPNRMVMTAARPDRSSFGCGESDKYPYFDACVLESLPTARDFAILGRAARACVEAREKAENLSPPSEPQLSVGGELRPVLPLLALRGP